VVLRGFDGTFAGMTVRAPAEGGAVLVDGGAPLLQDLWMTVDPGSYGTLAMGGVSQPVVRDSLLEGYVLTDSDGTSPLMEGNTFTQVPVTLSGPGESTLRGNTFAEGSGISASEDLTGLIEGNTFIGGQPGMPSELGLGIKAGSDLVVRGNTFSDLDIGISVDAYAAATIEGNEFDDDGMAVTWGSTKGGSISDNTIRGGFAGITVSGGSPSITGNTIEDVTGRGLAVGVRANATVEGNSICGCGTNLVVDEASDSQVGENDVCTEGGAG
jgi:nitrous oxidase accessory protein NosD